MRTDIKKDLITIVIILLFTTINTSVFAERFPHRNGDLTGRLENVIRANQDGIIQFDANKTYLFSRTLNITKKVKLIGSNGTILKLNRSSRTGSFILCRAEEISFEKLTLNADNKVNRAIVDINDMVGVAFEEVTLINAIHPNFQTQGDAIAAYNGRACHGLIVNRCVFTNISHMCVKIMNRDTDKYRDSGPNRNRFINGEIRQLLAPISITNSTFNSGYDKAIEADCGNDDFVIDDQNDPRWVPEDLRGGRRYTYTTDLAESVIEGNTFKTHKAWVLGLIQASNMALRNNTMEGPANTTQGNNAIIHLEQVVHNLEISNNTMSLNSGFGNPIFISLAANEGRQRLRENPRVIAIRNRGGFTGNRGGNTVRGSNNCPRGANPLTCKKALHSFGPRNIYVFDNTFIANARILAVMNFSDAEGIRIGLDKNDTAKKNSYVGVPRNRVDRARIIMGRGESGNCDVIIKDPELIEGNAKDFRIGNGARMDNRADCIKINEDDPETTLSTNLNNTNTVDTVDIIDTINTINGIDTIEDSNINKFYFSPNPASSIINISGFTKNTYQVSIYNLSGVLVKKHEGNNDSIMSIDELSSGLYIISYRDATISKNDRLIIK